MAVYEESYRELHICVIPRVLFYLECYSILLDHIVFAILLCYISILINICYLENKPLKKKKKVNEFFFLVGLRAPEISRLALDATTLYQPFIHLSAALYKPFDF